MDVKNIHGMRRRRAWILGGVILLVAAVAVLWKIQETIANDRPWIMVNYLDALAAYRSDRFTFDPKLPLSGLKWALFTGFSVT